MLHGTLMRRLQSEKRKLFLTECFGFFSLEKIFVIPAFSAGGPFHLFRSFSRLLIFAPWLFMQIKLEGFRKKSLMAVFW
jgi:hypothetical protein